VHGASEDICKELGLRRDFGHPSGEARRGQRRFLFENLQTTSNLETHSLKQCAGNLRAVVGQRQSADRSSEAWVPQNPLFASGKKGSEQKSIRAGSYTVCEFSDRVLVIPLQHTRRPLSGRTAGQQICLAPIGTVPRERSHQKSVLLVPARLRIAL